HGSECGPRRARHPRIARCCPQLEGLEQRSLPSTIAFTQVMGGAWEDPMNWTDDMGMHRTPIGPEGGDDAYIPDLDPGASVTVTSGAGCRTLHTGESGTVVIDGGTLSLSPAVPSQLDGSIVLSGGALFMGSGTIVNNSFTWTGGKLGLGNNEPVYGPATLNVPIQIAG